MLIASTLCNAFAPSPLIKAPKKLKPLAHSQDISTDSEDSRNRLELYFRIQEVNMTCQHIKQCLDSPLTDRQFCFLLNLLLLQLGMTNQHAFKLTELTEYEVEWVLKSQSLIFTLEATTLHSDLHNRYEEVSRDWRAYSYLFISPSYLLSNSTQEDRIIIEP